MNEMSHMEMAKLVDELWLAGMAHRTQPTDDERPENQPAAQPTGDTDDDDV